MPLTHRHTIYKCSLKSGSKGKIIDDITFYGEGKPRVTKEKNDLGEGGQFPFAVDMLHAGGRGELVSQKVTKRD